MRYKHPIYSLNTQIPATHALEVLTKGLETLQA